MGSFHVCLASHLSLATVSGAGAPREGALRPGRHADLPSHAGAAGLQLGGQKARARAARLRRCSMAGVHKWRLCFAAFLFAEMKICVHVFCGFLKGIHHYGTHLLICIFCPGGLKQIEAGVLEAYLDVRCQVSG